MKNRYSIMEQVAKVTDLPLEPLPGIPLVELAGERRVLVENHCGVIEYGCKEIGVKVSYGQVCVCGSDLKLARMTRYQLVITGNIERISLVRRGK